MTAPVRTEILRLELWLRRRSTVGYLTGMGLYTFVIVALYPSFRHDTSLDSLTRHAPTLSALFGLIGSLTSPAGWLDANIYANFFPLVMLLLTIGYGASSIAGRDEEGSLALVVALPVARGHVATQKILAMVVQGLVVAAGVAVVVVIGRSFELGIPVGHVVGSSVSVVLLGVDFGLLAMAVGAVTGRRGTALAVATAVAAASYLVSSLAPVVSWVRPARFASLFYWSVGNGQLTDGLSLVDGVVLVVVAVAAAGATVVAFRRMDVR